MKTTTISLFSMAILFAVIIQHTTSHPAPGGVQQTLDKSEVMEIVPVNDQENSEDIAAQISERNKRTIGMLRQLFPQLSEMIDKKVEELVQYFVRIIGRAVLQGGLFGGGGDDDDSEARSAGGSSSSSSSGSSRRVSITLPTFPPDADDDDDDDDDSNASVSSSSSNSTTSSAAAALQAAADNNDNALAGAESQNNEVRVAYKEDEDVEEAELNEENDDQSAAASNNEPGSLDDLDNVETSDDNDRNKRFLSFGFGGDASASAGGSGGGSGNFLFDIIRNTADRAARAAGTVYRVVAGTESLGFGLTATSSQTKTLQPVTNPPVQNPPTTQNGGVMGTFLQKLVAGSGTSEAADEAANGASVDGTGKVDATYQEGIPGPITRLFVIANRGISNLIQDLILRLAQTSERIVNFKARLITSLI